MNNVANILDTSGDKSLALWAAKKFSLFVIFKFSGDSGGSTRCEIDEFSKAVLRLSWPIEPEGTRRGELVISLKGASRAISATDLGEIVSGHDFIDPHEKFVLITLPSGEKYWLVMMRPLELENP